jgi:hypothetical protein
MPEIPPWLNPSAAQGWGQLALEASKVGQQGAIASAQMAQEAQRLNQQYQLAQQDHQFKQQQMEKDRLQEEARLAIEKSYKEQVIGLQEQELKTKQQELELKTRRAAQQYSAAEKVRTLMLNGMSAKDAYLAVGVDALGGSGTGFGSLIGNLSKGGASIPREWVGRDPTKFYLGDNGRAYNPVKQAQSPMVVERTEYPEVPSRQGFPAKPGGLFGWGSAPAIPEIKGSPKRVVTRKFPDKGVERTFDYDPTTGQMIPVDQTQDPEEDDLSDVETNGE